ncbi:MAG TPA: LysR family transcriptional regulator [Sporichthyaceae bacterium]|nr:LysR family transcriptional regulator [Sporichthyaceae bacterium]
MELRQLEYFVAVADELSFSRGARRADVVQSAVSTSVGKLERELGTPLFDRSRQRIALTPAGRTFLEQARATLEAARRARDSVAGFDGRLTGTVEIGTLMSSGPFDLPAALGRFGTAHPLVSVRLRQSPSGSAGHLAAVAEGSLDLALVSTTGRPAKVELRPLVTEPLVFLCRPEHHLARRRRIEVADLAEETFVHFVAGWGIRREVDRAFRDAAVEPAAPYEVSDYATAVGLVRHGLGTTLLPRSAARPAADLRALPVSPALGWQLSLALPEARTLPAAAAALAEVLGSRQRQS